MFAWWMGWSVPFAGFDLLFFSHGFTVLVSLFWSSQLMGLLGFKKMNHGWSAVGRSIWSVAPVDGLIHLMTIDFFFTWVCDPSSCSGFDRWRTRRMGLLGLCNESCYGFDRVLGLIVFCACAMNHRFDQISCACAMNFAGLCSSLLGFDETVRLVFSFLHFSSILRFSSQRLFWLLCSVGPNKY